jgi:hypothetical protein
MYNGRFTPQIVAIHMLKTGLRAKNAVFKLKVS